MTRKINAAVTALNNIDSPGPGIPFVRGLRESKAFDSRIIGFSYEFLEPGIYMHDHIDKSYQIPYPSAGTDSLLARLEYIHSLENIDVLIPNFDAELFSFIRLEERLRKMGIAMLLPTLEQFEERHKAVLSDYGKKYDIPVPYSRSILNYNDISLLSNDFSYPLLVKGKYYDAYVAYNISEVQFYFNKLNAKWGLPVIIQQYIKGTEVNVAALGDGKGQTIGAVPMRKTYITDKGKAWAGITLDDKNLLSMTHTLIEATKWRGGMELEVIKTNNDEYYLVEINPRLPAWLYLAVGAGQNLPEAMVKLALGMDVKPYKKYDIGKLFIRYSYDLIVDLKEFMNISTHGEL
jgi:carbamoyl-phosphate synthase large subunit